MSRLVEVFQLPDGPPSAGDFHAQKLPQEPNTMMKVFFFFFSSQLYLHICYMLHIYIRSAP
jgi:hypothetical protein